jgi:hypothetical protein
MLKLGWIGSARRSKSDGRQPATGGRRQADERKARSAAGTVVLERTYQARVEEQWALWTIKKGFESWWGPEGFRVKVPASSPIWTSVRDDLKRGTSRSAPT